jgi:hypothetical protein
VYEYNNGEARVAQITKVDSNNVSLASVLSSDYVCVCVCERGQ